MYYLINILNAYLSTYIESHNKLIIIYGLTQSSFDFYENWNNSMKIFYFSYPLQFLLPTTSHTKIKNLVCLNSAPSTAYHNLLFCSSFPLPIKQSLFPPLYSKFLPVELQKIILVLALYTSNNMRIKIILLCLM